MVAATGILAWAGRGYIQEAWWISELNSSNRTQRNIAAEKLAERKCYRAVPHILRIIAKDSSEDTSTIWFNFAAAVDVGTYRRASPLILFLWRMGDDVNAMTVIERAGQKLLNENVIGDQFRFKRILKEIQDRDIAMKPTAVARRTATPPAKP